uniref:Assembly factor for spindle microtubules n=1 Tax=Tetraodon nigroviridis TaxID=99883 RepID=H3D460_TETNG
MNTGSTSASTWQMSPIECSEPNMLRHPVKRDDGNKENDAPTLRLLQFSRAPFLTFGTVKLGTSRSTNLQIENPTEDTEAEVKVEKIPSSKGFSVNHSTFTIPPEESFCLTVTWTPTEEGGVREVLTFTANGLLKHQAILLGRAEAPRRKKRNLWCSNLSSNTEVFCALGIIVSSVSVSCLCLIFVWGLQKSLWDAIKNKTGSTQAAAPRRKVTDQPLKMASNKAFQVSRKPQYKRATLRSPLASLNKDKAETARPFSKQSPQTSPQQMASNSASQENIYEVCRQSSRDPKSDANEMYLNPDDTLRKHENKDLIKILNKTLSPIGTPERLKRLMPQIYHESPLSAAVKPAPSLEDSHGGVTGTPVLSVKEALVLIDSDLSHINSSPQDTSQSDSFSDSLESKSGSRGCEADDHFLKALPDSPRQADACEQRLTFFVTKKTASEAAGSEPIIKAPFTSVTVTKVRAPVRANSLSGRKMRKSKRRLLEERLELPDGSSDSGTGTPSLPVIEDLPPTISSPVISHPSVPPDHVSSSTTSPLPADTSITSSSPLITSSPLHPKRCVKPDTNKPSPPAPAPPPGQEDLFPVHMAVKSKKRKSEKKKSPQSLKSSALSSVRTSKIVAVAQSKLTFIKPKQNAIPRHPMPFAAKNMFYDERWIEKQENAFTCWINYMLTPDDFKVNTEVAKVNAVSIAMGSDDKFSVPKAPTKEEVSFSTYTARRKLNRLRRSACQLFASDVMIKAIQRLELEVEAKRLLVRKDRHLWKDIGERRKVLNWLLSYNPLWLRIGLETIYGELIPLESNSDVVGLAMFILHRLLWNPDIAAEFRHAKVPHLYKDGHEEVLSRFTLKKLLLLVCFLDRAKESRLIEHNPCLFCLDAEFKASKDLLLAFSRDFLSGEGILPRHLGYLGLPVSHVQTPLDEFNFAVKSLALDLKCGTRLVRVMELLMQDWSFSAKLRLPAISRLQKIHNVDVALQILKSKGVDLKDDSGNIIDSRDVVDGHREKTLSLLWKIIFAFQVEVILDENQLREEIGFLKRALRTKQRLALLRANQNLQRTSGPTSTPHKHSSVKISLLMDWVRAVCDFYGVKVENFTVSFSDGRVLCYLVHHYHPSLLPDKSVSLLTTQTVECSLRGRVELDCSTNESDNSFDSLPTGLNELGPDSPSVEFKELLENEKSNFRLINSAVSFLGGVPAMINPADMSNTIPNEKVVVSYLSFLCARLLDLRNETRAARVIQAAWRKYRLKQDLKLYEERNLAALKIQRAVREFLQKRRAKQQDLAATIIQAAWRGLALRNRLRREREAQSQALRNKAATIIQARWRMFLALKAYQQLRYYAIVLQSQWRMRRASSAYGRLYWAATVVQGRWRARGLAKKDREYFCSLRASVVKMQRGYRRRKHRKTQQENHAAAVIQTAFKKWFKERMDARTGAAVRIQSWYRMQKCHIQYKNIKSSVVLIQAHYRGYAQRKQVAKMKYAAALIQRWFRACTDRDLQRQTFVQLRSAAVTVQAAYRGKRARDSLKKQHRAATVIQAAFRKHAAQQRFLQLRKAAVVVQANWRGRADRKEIARKHQYATLIKAHYRRYKARAEYRSQKAAAVAIQRHYRAYMAAKETRKAYLRLRAACLTLQAGFRGRRVRTELKERHLAATVIQTSVRMFLCKKRYFLLQSAAVVIQCRYRALVLGRKQQNEYRVLRQATTTIQAMYRGFRAREELKKRHAAARAIQTQFRMYRMRTVFLATKFAAIFVQEHYRAIKLRDRQQQTYTAMRAAARVIQAGYRGYRTRREVAQMHQAAAVIQRRFLSIRERKRFLAIKTAVLVCQQRFRAVTLMRKARSDYLSQRRAVISLQAACRGYLGRKHLRIQHAAAVTIQSHFRKHRQRKSYRRLQWAASVLQERYRSNQAMKQEMLLLNAKKRAVIILQAAFRGMKCRSQLKRRHQAADVIQRVYRARRERKQYLTLRSSVVTIQRRYRATVAAKEEVKLYQRMRRAAVLLQAAFRGQRVRKEVARWHRAATVIQSAFRSHQQQIKFQAMRLSAVVIQRYYRSCILQRRERETFLETRRSAIVLQAAFRGQRVRRSVNNMHRAATVIQANFRRFKLQSAFRRQRQAACVLQQRFRAQRQKNVEVKHYQQLRNAAVVLQAAYRGMKCRNIIKRRHRAASVIQRAFRAPCERKQYLTLRSAVVIIQRRYRATVAAKEEVKLYQRMRRAAVLLQAAFRGQRVRKEVARWHRAATVIQSAFRSHQQQIKFQAMRLSAVVIQRYYRSCILQRRERETFLEMRRSAIVLQAAFRGQRVRRSVNNMHRAATVIQANFRRLKLQSAFRRQRQAACVLQQRFRAQRQKNVEVKHYQQLRNAAVVLQAAYRGMKCRNIIKRRHRAASVIQRAFRAHCERKQYLTLRSAVVIIQRRYRATVAAKEEVKLYQRMRRAAVLLQAAFRGQRVRKEVARWHRAATVIQSAFRSHQQQIKFQAMRLSAVVIQRYYRSCILQRRERETFLETRRSAIVLQAAFRGRRVRRSVNNMHRAATVIQANFRRFKLQSAFRRQRQAACVLQQRFRAQRQKNVEVKHYQQLRNAAVVLQAAYRGMKCRNIIKRRHRAASVIQRAFRAHCERKQYLTLRSAVVIIQRRYRATVAAKEEVKLYQRMRRAAVLLQAAFRGQRVRKEVARWHRAATVIQSAFRSHQQQIKFQAMRLSAVVIQRYYRSCILQRRERETFLETRRSAIVLQAAFRGRRVRRSVNNMHRAATVIQANFRRFKLQSAFRRQRQAACVLQQRFRAQRQKNVELRRYQEVRKAVLILQAGCRGMKSRRTVKERQHAASVVQRAYRAHLHHKHYLRLRSSVVVLQRRFRAAAAAKAERLRYLETRASVTVIQAAYRGQRVRKEMGRRHQAATVIQSAFRQRRVEDKYQTLRLSAITIQRRYRSRILQRRAREEFLKVKRCATTLQAAYRGWRLRRDRRRQRQAAIRIQSCWRGFTQRREFLRKRTAAVKLQQKVRAVQLARLERKIFTQKRRAAIVIQQSCRAWIASQQAEEVQKAAKRLRFTSAVFHHLSAIKIQRSLRAYWALKSARTQIQSVIVIQRWVRAKQQRRRYLEDRRKVIVAQKAAKRWLRRRNEAASTIQQAVRKFLLLRHQRKFEQGIIKAQALWRGHRSRRLHDNPKVVKLRRRLHQLSADIREEDRLGNKTTSALEYLLRYKHFSYILEALKNLESATRLSPVCCERLVESGATNVIFTLIRSCNRSVPCMEVITFSIQVLLNLSKYHKTTEAVYSVENSVEILLDLLQRYREKAGDKVADKGSSIFTKACFLLALLLQDRHRALEVMNLPKVVERIGSIYRLTARKHQKDAERTFVKQKMNASVNGSFLVQATPRKSHPIPLPKFAPDWVLKKDKSKDVMDPLLAVKMVAQALLIVL